MKKRRSTISTKVMPIAKQNYELAKKHEDFREGYLKKVMRLGNVKSKEDLTDMLLRTDNHIIFLRESGVLINN